MEDNFEGRVNLPSSHPSGKSLLSSDSISNVSTGPKSLVTRFSDNLIATINPKKDCFFPHAKKVSYDNFIVGFKHKPIDDGNYHGVNVIMSDGECS